LSAFPPGCYENVSNLLWKVVIAEGSPDIGHTTIPDSFVVDVGHCGRGVAEGLSMGAGSRAGCINVEGGLETKFKLAKVGRSVHPLLGLD